MDKEICMKCRLCPDHFVLKQKRKLNIITNYFYGYDGNCFKENTERCLIIGTCNIHYCNYPDEKSIYYLDEILSYKDINPDKERCPYYFEHQLNDWNDK